MNTNMLPTIDHPFFYRNSEKWIPIIAAANADPTSLSLSNTILITLPAHPGDDLIWKEQREEALEALQKEKLILWEFDFGLSKNILDADDTAFFHSMTLAIEEFSSYIFKEFSDHTLGVVMYRGSLNFYDMLAPTESRRRLFVERVDDLDLQEQVVALTCCLKEWPLSILNNPLFQLYAADVVAEYIQRLISYLPDAVNPFIMLDATDQKDITMLAYLTSTERFPHVVMALKRSPIAAGVLNWEEGACYGGWIGEGAAYLSTPSDVVVGICLPPEEYLSQALSLSLSNVLCDLQESQTPYRIIPESQLTEAWHGLDYIIVFGLYLSTQGKRRLQGFCAAGGCAVVVDESQGLSLECSYKDFKEEYIKSGEFSVTE